MSEIKYSVLCDPTSWSVTDGGAVLPFKFATHEDAKLASQWANELLSELYAARQENQVKMLQTTAKDFVAMYNKAPDVVGVPVYYAVYPPAPLVSKS